MCRLVLLVKVGWRQGRALGSEEYEMIGSKLFDGTAGGIIWGLGLSLEFCVWRAA